MRFLLFFLPLIQFINTQISFDIEFRPFIPTPIIHPIAGVHNNTLIVLGGITRDNSQNSIPQENIYTLDLSSLKVNASKGLYYNKSIEWTTINNGGGIIIPSGSVQTSIQLNNKLYIPYYVTRTDDPGIAIGSNFWSNKMAVFNLNTLGYDTEITIPRTDTSACVMTDYNQYIYIVGGDDGTPDVVGGNRVTIWYDINGNGGIGQWGNGPDLVNKRWNAGCAFDRDGNIGYIFGGSGPARNTTLNTIEKLTGGTTGSWSIINGETLRVSRSHSPCITDRYSTENNVPNYRIYCIGGRTGTRTEQLQDVETFNTNTETILLQGGNLLWKVYKQALVQYPLQSTSNTLFWLGGEYIEQQTYFHDKIYYLTLGEFTSLSPTMGESINPTIFPTKYPSKIPTMYPTSNTILPTINTKQPSLIPTKIPTINPTLNTVQPTQIPSINPSLNTVQPTLIPSKYPTIIPTVNPTPFGQTIPPTLITNIPTKLPSIAPVIGGGGGNTFSPTQIPTMITTVDIMTTKPNSNKTNNPFGLSDLMWILIIVLSIVFCCVLFILILVFCICKKGDKDDNNKLTETNELQQIRSDDSGRTSGKTNDLKKVKTIEDSDDNVIDAGLNETAGNTVAPTKDSDSDNDPSISDSELKKKYGKKMKNNDDSDSGRVSDDELNKRYGGKTDNVNNDKNLKKNKYVEDSDSSSY